MEAAPQETRSEEPTPGFQRRQYPYGGYYGAASDIAASEGLLRSPQASDRIMGKLALAWYIRQTDPDRADRLAEEVRDGFAMANPDSVFENIVPLAALSLLKAELARLSACRDMAMELAGQAERQFDAISCHIGVGDALLVQAECLVAAGRYAAVPDVLARAVTRYDWSEDRRRADFAKAFFAFHQHSIDPETAQVRWTGIFSDPDAYVGTPALTYALAFRGALDFHAGALAQAVIAWGRAFDLAQIYGARTFAITLGISIGVAYGHLCDLPAAMEWQQKAHTLAENMGWPVMQVAALTALAETARAVGQTARAGVLFEQALHHLSALPESSAHATAYKGKGVLCLGQGSMEAALQWFSKALGIAEYLGQWDVVLPCLNGTALALGQLGRYEDALATAQRARSLAASLHCPLQELEALRCLAVLHMAQTPDDPGTAIVALEAALALMAGGDDDTVFTELCALLAQAYEAKGDFRVALGYERQAVQGLKRYAARQQDARQQISQNRFDSAQSNMDTSHHRALAVAEAERATRLEQTNQLLERLSGIGRELTAGLNGDGVFQTLSRHIADLIPVDCLYIGLLDGPAQQIDIRFRVEGGKRLPARQVALASSHLSARCLRKNEEMLVDWEVGLWPQVALGTQPIRTVLLRPLALGDRVLGVICVQSAQARAYGARELMIFRTLCAYSAIALANAESYSQLEQMVRELRAAMNRLTQQEKTAMLGQLVAGVAHEMNTPLGVTLSAVSQLRDEFRALSQMIEAQTLTRSTLADHLETGTVLADMAQRNITRAADLVCSFKELAVVPAGEDGCDLELDSYLREIVALMLEKRAVAGNPVEFDIPPLKIRTYAGALAQVLTNLLTNVVDHAYGVTGYGRIAISARPMAADMVEITIIDEGAGIAPDILPRIFDPFFTTGRAGGHIGLGLHVAYNQVTQRLNGTIFIQSIVGAGTRVTVRIPRMVPAAHPLAISFDRIEQRGERFTGIRRWSGSG